MYATALCVRNSNDKVSLCVSDSNKLLSFFYRERKITSNFSLNSDSSNLEIYSCCVILHTLLAWHASRDSYFIDNLFRRRHIYRCHRGYLLVWFRIQYAWNIVDKFNSYFTLGYFSFKVHLLKTEAIKTNNNTA